MTRLLLWLRTRTTRLDIVEIGAVNDLGIAASMPDGEHTITVSAVVLAVLDPAADIGDTAETETEAEEDGCHAIGRKRRG